MEQKEFYYCHATALENLDSIIKNGIKANESGEIYLYEDCILIDLKRITGSVNDGWLENGVLHRYVGDMIARNQIFIPGEKYVNFYIPAKAISGELERDNVAELTARHQWIAHQSVIYPVAYETRTIGKPESKPIFINRKDR